MNWVFGLDVEFDAIGTRRMSHDSKHTYSGMIKSDFSSGGGNDSKEEELASNAKENEILDLYISDNSSALFFPLSFSLRLEPASVLVSDLDSSMWLVLVLTSSFKSIF